MGLLLSKKTLPECNFKDIDEYLRWSLEDVKRAFLRWRELGSAAGPRINRRQFFEIFTDYSGELLVSWGEHIKWLCSGVCKWCAVLCHAMHESLGAGCKAPAVFSPHTCCMLHAVQHPPLQLRPLMCEWIGCVLCTPQSYQEEHFWGCQSATLPMCTTRPAQAKCMCTRCCSCCCSFVKENDERKRSLRLRCLTLTREAS